MKPAIKLIKDDKRITKTSIRLPWNVSLCMYVRCMCVFNVMVTVVVVRPRAQVSLVPQGAQRGRREQRVPLAQWLRVCAAAERAPRARV